MGFGFGLRRDSLPLVEKVGQISWTLVILLCLTAAIGAAMLYSAANGSLEPWAWRHMVRFTAGLGLMFVVALIDIRYLLRGAYLIYAIGLVMLIGVEFAGVSGMGAQRWIDLKVFRIQPSEIMKVALVLALARYFHGLTEVQVRRLPMLMIPATLILVPAWLVLRQPDLGTALLLVMGGTAMVYLAGVPLWVFGVAAIMALILLPVGWQFLYTYQQERILTFFNPESDPLGAGYHILQSKIALGSGSVFGKGYLEGTQSHLNFLPEKQTDFIFTMIAEEFGLLGVFVLLGLYVVILVICMAMTLRGCNQFGRLVGAGVTTIFFLYVFINIAMVTGLVPVVGIPLPLISYGGTAMTTVLVSFGLLMSAFIHRDVMLTRRTGLF